MYSCGVSGAVQTSASLLQTSIRFENVNNFFMGLKTVLNFVGGVWGRTISEITLEVSFQIYVVPNVNIFFGATPVFC